MLGNMAEPGAARALGILLIEPPDEAARLTVRAAVLLQRRDQLDQARVEVWQLAGGMLLQLLKIDGQTNDRPVAIWAWAAINAGLNNTHRILLVGTLPSILPHVRQDNALCFTMPIGLTQLCYF